MNLYIIFAPIVFASSFALAALVATKDKGMLDYTPTLRSQVQITKPLIIETVSKCKQEPAHALRKDIPFLGRQEQFTINVAHLIEYIYSQGYSCTFGETFRTKAQALLDAHAGIGIRDSNHCYRLAIDLNLFDKNGKYLTTVKDYLIFGEYWEKLNPFNEWGGRWRNGDCDHFEAD